MGLKERLRVQWKQKTNSEEICTGCIPTTGRRARVKGHGVLLGVAVNWCRFCHWIYHCVKMLGQSRSYCTRLASKIAIAPSFANCM